MDAPTSEVRYQGFRRRRRWMRTLTVFWLLGGLPLVVWLAVEAVDVAETLKSSNWKYVAALAIVLIPLFGLTVSLNLLSLAWGRCPTCNIYIGKTWPWMKQCPHCKSSLSLEGKANNNT